MKKAISLVFSPYVLYVLSALILFFGLFQKNSSFLRTRRLFARYFKTFSGSPLQCIMIFGVPLLLSVATARLAIVSEDIVNNIIIVLSIFISMFFAVLSILTSFNYKKDSDGEKIAKNTRAKRYNESLKNTVSIILVEALLCIVLLIISLAVLFVDSYSKTWLLTGISLVIYYLTFIVILNVFAIIKRMYVLFEEKAN